MPDTGFDVLNWSHKIDVEEAWKKTAGRMCLMGIDPSWVGYLQFCHKAGISQYDLSKIDLVGGVQIASIRKQYKMAPNIDTLLKWPFCAAENRAEKPSPASLNGAPCDSSRRNSPAAAWV